jgi:hypothetical protein
MGGHAEGDGALTTQVLKLSSGYPTLLFCARNYDLQNRLFVCCNCGSQPSRYAAPSEDPTRKLALYVHRAGSYQLKGLRGENDDVKI